MSDSLPVRHELLKSVIVRQIALNESLRVERDQATGERGVIGRHQAGTSSSEAWAGTAIYRYIEEPLHS